jgi:hypothetical protein
LPFADARGQGYLNRALSQGHPHRARHDLF